MTTEHLPDSAIDPFLVEDGSVEDFGVLADALAPCPPAPLARSALLEAVTLRGRFERFIPLVAARLDVSLALAAQLLDRLDEPSNWKRGPVRGISLLHANGGPAVSGAITGFIRQAAGISFPEHEHVGEECALILQGSGLNSADGGIWRPGSEMWMSGGSSHCVVARPGPDLVYLVVAAGGIRLGGELIAADDPRA